MKASIVLGTRPEIIKFSPIIPKLVCLGLSSVSSFWQADVLCRNL